MNIDERVHIVLCRYTRNKLRELATAGKNSVQLKLLKLYSYI